MYHLASYCAIDACLAGVAVINSSVAKVDTMIRCHRLSEAIVAFSSQMPTKLERTLILNDSTRRDGMIANKNNDSNFTFPRM